MSAEVSLPEQQLDKPLWGVTELPSFKLTQIQALLQLNTLVDAAELAGQINHDPG